MSHSSPSATSLRLNLDHDPADLPEAKEMLRRAKSIIAQHRRQIDGLQITVQTFQALRSETVPAMQPNICAVCEADFSLRKDCDDNLCPNRERFASSAIATPEDAALLEMCHGTLRELIKRIEKCGASPELTHAVTLCSDLMMAVGRDKYAQQRVRDELKRGNQ